MLEKNCRFEPLKQKLGWLKRDCNDMGQLSCLLSRLLSFLTHSILIDQVMSFITRKIMPTWLVTALFIA